MEEMIPLTIILGIVFVIIVFYLGTIYQDNVSAEKSPKLIPLVIPTAVERIEKEIKAIFGSDKILSCKLSDDGSSLVVIYATDENFYKRYNQNTINNDLSVIKSFAEPMLSLRGRALKSVYIVTDKGQYLGALNQNSPCVKTHEKIEKDSDKNTGKSE